MNECYKPAQSKMKRSKLHVTDEGKMRLRAGSAGPTMTHPQQGPDLETRWKAVV